MYSRAFGEKNSCAGEQKNMQIFFFFFFMGEYVEFEERKLNSSSSVDK